MLALALAPAVSGCGESRQGAGSTAKTTTAAASSQEARKPPRQILEDAAGALSRARSVAVRGRLKLDGRPGEMTLEEERPGRLRVNIDRGGGSASVISVAGQSYVKANEAFLSQKAHAPAALLGLLAGRWLRAEDREDLGFESLNIRKLAKCLATETGTLSFAGERDQGGEPAVVIVDKGDAPGSSPARYYIAARGEPFLLGVVATGDARPGGRPGSACSETGGGGATEKGSELTFGDYDKPLGIVAPSGALTPRQLARRLGS